MIPATVLNTAGRAIRDQYRLGLALFLTAPIAVALVVVPEFIQHVAEIRIGMFESRAIAHALANDPMRWAFGYVKLAGLALSFLACARAVWCGLQGGRWYDLREVAWPRFIGGLVLFLVVGSLAAPFSGRIDARAILALNVVATVISLPLLFLVLSGLFGDWVTSWRPLLLRSWPAALLLLLLFVTGFAVPQAIHMGDHFLAFGRPAVLVWALMAWDALVVGALAALTGAGFAISYGVARARAH